MHTTLAAQLAALELGHLNIAALDRAPCTDPVDADAAEQTLVGPDDFGGVTRAAGQFDLDGRSGRHAGLAFHQHAGAREVVDLDPAFARRRGGASLEADGWAKICNSR